LNRAILVASFAAVSGCVAPQPPPPPVSAGQALAQYTCPHRIAEAHAWVNMMPAINRASRSLVVDIRLADQTDTAVILRSAASTGDTLVLEIRTSPVAPIPGHLAYREPAPEQLYKRISFFCRGGEIASITQIDKVY